MVVRLVQERAPMKNTAATQQSIEEKGDGAAAWTGLVLQDTYALGPRIGQGGMGEVYEAKHLRLPARVAVKILQSGLLTNRDACARFRREAEIMSELRHPHIVQVFDFNTSVSGLPYFVMEYLEGIDLAKRLTNSAVLSLAALVRIVDAVASALSAAHTLGIVHRDLKPSNIFLMRGEGQHNFVKVLDFGISTVAGLGPRLSRESEIGGTPEFMAPEQALGRVNQVDGRTDQFALAAVAYAMLTRREPFVAGDPTSLLYQVVHEQPLPLSHFLSWDTTALQSVLDRALSKRQEDRFGSILEFARALRAATHSVIHGPAATAVISLPLDGAEPPFPLALLRTPPGHAVATLGEAQLPRRLDRVPHGPQRVVAFGLGLLGVAALVVFNGGYRGFPRRAVNFGQGLVSLVRGGWRAPPPSLPPTAADVRPVMMGPPEVSPPLGRPPSREPASDIAAPGDQTPPPAPEVPPRAGRPAVRPASRRQDTTSRSGWQAIDLPYHAPMPTPPTASEGFSARQRSAAPEF
jgi:serine/threonine-protein kinase